MAKIVISHKDCGANIQNDGERSAPGEGKRTRKLPDEMGMHAMTAKQQRQTAVFLISDDDRRQDEMLP